MTSASARQPALGAWRCLLACLAAGAPLPLAFAHELPAAGATLALPACTAAAGAVRGDAISGGLSHEAVQRQDDPAGEADLLRRGRLAIRAMDCARCHGRDHDGWAAPSLLAAVREGSRQRFVTFVLDGDIARGMPGYREQPVVVDNLAAIYAYLRDRAGIGSRTPADDTWRDIRTRPPALSCFQAEERHDRPARHQ
jgi:cytochrome c55X